MPDVSIVLLTKNAGPGFEATLQAVCAQRFDGAFDIVAIDSGSTDGTLDLLRRHAIRVETIAPERFGFGATKNLAAALVSGDVVVFLSQDARPASDGWLAALTAPLAEPGVAAAHGRQLPWPHTTPMERFFLDATYPPQPSRLTGDLPPFGVALSNVNAALRRETLLAHPFGEALVMSEDQAWAQEMLRAGCTIVYEPAAAVFHAHQYSLAGVFRRSFDSGMTLRGLLPDGRSPLRARGLSYLWHELAAVLRSHGPAWAAYALLYEAARAAGYAIGSAGARLPLSLVRRLSAHPQLWQRRRAPGAGPAAPVPAVAPAAGDRP